MLETVQDAHYLETLMISKPSVRLFPASAIGMNSENLMSMNHLGPECSRKVHACTRSSFVRLGDVLLRHAGCTRPESVGYYSRNKCE